MSYKVVEIFHSIQSEGTWAGTPATFIRFYGCNLQCNFGKFKCDEPLHTDKEAITEMKGAEILAELGEIRHVVITGGEPSLNDLNDLIGAIKSQNYYVQVETNGHNLDNIKMANFITYSPKFQWDDKASKLQSGFHELKLLADKDSIPNPYAWHSVKLKFIQPIADGDVLNMENIKWCHDWVVANPTWKLSLQSHKLYGAE